MPVDDAHRQKKSYKQHSLSRQRYERELGLVYEDIELSLTGHRLKSLRCSSQPMWNVCQPKCGCFAI